MRPLRKLQSGALIVSLLIPLTGCFMTTGKIMDEIELQQLQGNNDRILDLSLEALDANPNHKDAMEAFGTVKSEVMQESWNRAKRIGKSDPRRAAAELTSLYLRFQTINTRMPGSISADDLELMRSDIEGLLARESEGQLEAGHAAFEDGDNEMAIRRFIAASKSAPLDQFSNNRLTEAYYNVAESLRMAGQTREAVRNYELALERNPNYGDARRQALDSRFMLAWCYRDQGKMRLACLEAEELADRAPEFVPDTSALSVSNDMKDLKAKDWADKFRSMATVRVLVKPFTPGGSSNSSFGDVASIIRGKVKSKINDLRSPGEFIVTIDPENMEVAMNEVNRSGVLEVSEDTRLSAGFEAPSAYMEGGIKTFTIHRPEPEYQMMQGTVDVWIQNGQTGQNVAVPYTYRQGKKEARVVVEAWVKLVGVEKAINLGDTTRSMIEEDGQEWVDSFQTNPPNGFTAQDIMARIPENVRNMMAQERTLKTDDEMFRDAVEKLSRSLAEVVLDQVDVIEERAQLPEPCLGR